MGKDYEQELNELYKTDSIKYKEYLDFVKGLGCKVFRNSKGEHKVQYNVDDVINAFDQINKQRKRDNIEAFMKGFLGK